MKKFNTDSAAAAASAEASASQPKKAMHKKSLHINPVLHLQCPHGQAPLLCHQGQIPQGPHGKFLRLLLQSPQLLRQSLQLLRQNPQHLCISPRAKGLKASLLPQEHLQAPLLLEIPQLVPLEALAQVLTRSRSPSMYLLMMMRLMMKNLPKSSETGKPGPLEPKAAMCH